MPVSEEAVLKKDDIVEVEGLVRLTAASLAGKMLYVLRKYHPTGPQPRIPVYGPVGTADRMARAYDLDLARI